MTAEPSAETGATQGDGRNRSFGAMVVAFSRNRSAVVGAGLVALMLILAVAAPVLAPYSPTHPFQSGLLPDGAPVGPSARFLLGTDELGRDVLSRLIWGARISVEVGVLTALLVTVIGTVVGLVAGFAGGALDQAIMRITDLILAFPFLLFVIFLLAVLKHPGVGVMILVLGLTGWAGIARVARAQTLAVAKRDYVESARAVGSSSAYMLRRHILPNMISPIVVMGALRVGNYMVIEAGLSYLGIGIPPPAPSWGSMIAEGQAIFQVAPWLLIAPGFMLAAAVMGFNLLSDGINDVLNPRVRTTRTAANARTRNLTRRASPQSSVANGGGVHE